MKHLFYIYNNNNIFVGFAEDETYASFIAIAYGGHYEEYTSEEFVYDKYEAIPL